jgi:hypothetical protein
MRQARFSFSVEVVADVPDHVSDEEVALAAEDLFKDFSGVMAELDEESEGHTVSTMSPVTFEFITA